MSPQPHIEPAAELDAALTAELPGSIEVGGGTVVLIEGRCTDAADPGSLRLTLGSLSTAPDAERMPKPGSLGPGDRWWVLLTIPAEMPAGEHDLVLEATVGGGRARVLLGSIVLSAFDPRLAPPSPSIVSSSDGPLVCICMATHEPDPERLAAQLESIRAQDWPDWVCVISDDASSPARFEPIRELTAGDERFVVSRSSERLGFYRNFERALRMAPVEARWVALADQDDNWDADKISALATALSAPRVLLAYSDMRILDEHGRLLSDTYWILRRNSWDDVASMLVANTVTGAASMFERSLLEDALPFPPPIGEPYHDHWLALCALALGELSYVSRPTYERTRHLESVTAGTRHAETLRAMRDGTEAPPQRAPRRLRERLAQGAGWRAVYFHRWLQLVSFARILLLRGGGRIEPAKAKVLRRTVAAEHSAAAAVWLGLRSLRPLAGRDETLGRERVLLGGVVWSRLAGTRLRKRERRPEAALDLVPELGELRADHLVHGSLLGLAQVLAPEPGGGGADTLAPAAQAVAQRPEPVRPRRGPDLARVAPEPEPCVEPAELALGVGEQILVAHRDRVSGAELPAGALGGGDPDQPQVRLAADSAQALLGGDQRFDALGPGAPAAGRVGVHHRVDDVAAVAEQEDHPRVGQQVGDDLGRMRSVRLLDDDQRIGDPVCDLGPL